MEITLNLSDDVASRARDEGLLSAEAVQKLLEEALRRVAGQRLLQVAAKIHAAGIEPMSEDEVAAEVMAHRAEKRAKRLSGLRDQGLT